MVKKDILQSGFTLPEVIVAMSVLILVITASTNLLVSIIRNNNENVNTLVAYGLAQEGLEGFRSVRDSNWLLGADFHGKIGHHPSVWGVFLADTIDPKYYLLDMNIIDQGLCTSFVGVDVIANCAPWKLKEVFPEPGQILPDQESTQLYLRENGERVEYVHEVEARKSLFQRYLKVVTVPYNSAQDKKYRVTSVVTWKQGIRDKEVRLITELTDWKGGPL